jgi:hypothetical protein
MDLEQEFQKLMQEVIDKIQSKKDSGEYDTWDAFDLDQKVKSILDHGDTSRHGNQCPDGHDDLHCGWSPSMGYHCA